MKVQNVELTISAVSPAQYPNEGFPEIALSGRSNVGKSSLINTLINRKGWQGHQVSPERRRRLIFTILNPNCILWTCQDMGTQKFRKRS